MENCLNRHFKNNREWPKNMRKKLFKSQKKTEIQITISMNYYFIFKRIAQ